MLSYLAIGGIIAGATGVIAMVLASGNIGPLYRGGVVLAVLGLAAFLIAAVAGLVIEGRERRRDSAPRGSDE